MVEKQTSRSILYGVKIWEGEEVEVRELIVPPTDIPPLEKSVECMLSKTRRAEKGSLSKVQAMGVFIAEAEEEQLTSTEVMMEMDSQKRTLTRGMITDRAIPMFMFGSKAYAVPAEHQLRQNGE